MYRVKKVLQFYSTVALSSFVFMSITVTCLGLCVGSIIVINPYRVSKGFFHYFALATFRVFNDVLVLLQGINLGGFGKHKGGFHHSPWGRQCIT